MQNNLETDMYRTGHAPLVHINWNSSDQSEAFSRALVSLREIEFIPFRDGERQIQDPSADVISLYVRATDLGRARAILAENGYKIEHSGQLTFRF